MTIRLPALLCGASLLAFALPAAAQDHQHHPGMAMPAPAPAPQTLPTPVDPHAGHDMSGMDMSDGEPMAGMEPAMTSALGPWPMTRDASGTSWQPDASGHAGIHTALGDWTVMTHASFDLVFDRQNGPRGDDKTFLSGMVMTSARRDFAGGSTLNLRAMVSPDPLMGRDGYPLLLAAGETADGATTLVDRQHPHDFVMELSASYARPLSDTDSVFLYLGLPGEPAFGPPAFMHRMSAMDSPEAPITHHWLDSTHITFGVATLGWVHDRFKLEGSAFRGREPDQDRWDIERPELDSWSARASWNPTDQWSLQASVADLTSPEQLDPDTDERRWSASAIHTRRFGDVGWWSSTLAWGRKTADHGEAKNGWLLETAVSPDDRWTLFARAERIETDELSPGPGGGHGPLYTVGKVSVGVVRDWQVTDHVRFGLGGQYAVNRLPAGLEPAYSGDPDGTMLFARLKID